jgi:type IV secretory pathway VirB10-like protein
MKTMTTIALALAGALMVPAALADNEGTPQPKSKCVPPVGEQCPQTKKAAPKQNKAKEAPVEPETSAAEPTQETSTPSTPEAEPNAPPTTPPEAVGGGPVETEPMQPMPPAPVATQPPMTSETVQTTTVVEEEHRHVRRGIGINAIGSVGFREDARWGLGGRVEYVFGFGLSLGGSYQVHWVSEGDTTAVRPLLGEIGWAFAPVRFLEVRPIIGLGRAFADAERATYTNDQGQNVTTRAAISSGFDFAPGVKLSMVAGPLEIFTLPKYHVISGNNFAAIELGAGVRL